MWCETTSGPATASPHRTGHSKRFQRLFVESTVAAKIGPFAEKDSNDDVMFAKKYGVSAGGGTESILFRVPESEMGSDEKVNVESEADVASCDDQTFSACPKRVHQSGHGECAGSHRKQEL